MLTDPNEKGGRAEEFMQKILKGKNQTFETILWDRKVDLWDEKNKYAHEIKVWQNSISYDWLVKKQIQKEIELIEIHWKNYNPIWHFLEKWPTWKFVDWIPNWWLLKELEYNWIGYVIYK